MTTEERERLMVEMCRKWPNKFSDDDLAHWCDNLEHFRVDDVLDVLTGWKAESKWVPKLPEIRSRLANRTGAVRKQQQSYVTVVAQGIARANPRLDGRPEAELILRYHRAYFLRYAGQQRDAGLPDADEAITRRRDKHVRDAVSDLTASGMDLTTATDLAGWIDADEPDFDNAVRNIGAEAFAGAA